MLLRTLARDVMDFVYPWRCAACGEDAGGAFCARCELLLDALAASPACGRCAKPLATAGAPCPHCLGRGIFPFDRIVALGPFRDPLKHVIHGMKYHHRWAVAGLLAERLLACERTAGLLADVQVIVPVPLHWSRQISRGYNQADALARALARKCRLPVRRPLARVRPTETQTHLHSRARRAENLRGAFATIAPGGVRGRHVLLVDDVMTTAATLHSAARALAAAGPASVSAMVLAVADPRGQQFEAI